jgi:hypothetical protein
MSDVVWRHGLLSFVCAHLAEVCGDPLSADPVPAYLPDSAGQLLRQRLDGQGPACVVEAHHASGGAICCNLRSGCLAQLRGRARTSSAPHGAAGADGCGADVQQQRRRQQASKSSLCVTPRYVMLSGRRFHRGCVGCVSSCGVRHSVC